ncbi:Uncharacterised protein [Serratia odorifera]|uniref:Uncharacterized protein n=1 Tax=Serratia odorifera TaxID=618 RepID=A0A447KRN7_SEROD|nr:Uncharacterised protein [Serratia odorifera]
MRLPLWPVRHIHCANVAREHLVAHHLCAAVNTETDTFLLGIPCGRLKDFLFEQRGISAAVKWREVNGYPRYHCAFNKATP